MWDCATLQSLTEVCPRIRQNLSQVLMSRLHELEERFREVATEKVPRRLALALMRLSIEDTRLVDERVGQRPVYLILAMGADKVVRLKPQNLVAGLPLAAAANVA